MADGKVVSGLTGCGRYREESCYIVGLDARSGEELWRTSTIALPGQRGGDSWGDLPPMFRAGSDSWIPGSYDPVSRTLFHGTSQAKPWARAVRGTDGDALYTNSTLALDPDTGEMKWYYQHLPGETLDMDEVFERVLVDYDDRRSVFTMGKIAVLWEMALETGRFRNAHDLGYQTFAEVDSNTGAVRYREGMIPELNKEVFWCPSTAGFKSWRAMSYYPELETFYIPINLNCETAIFGPVERVEGGAIDIGFAILKNHQAGCMAALVLCRHIHPVVAIRAGVHPGFRKLGLGDFPAGDAELFLRVGMVRIFFLLCEGAWREQRAGDDELGQCRKVFHAPQGR